MRTWRWTELLQMLELTTTGSHTGSQALCEVCRRINVDVFLWQLFPGRLQSDLQLINRLNGLRLEFMALCQHGAQM